MIVIAADSGASSSPSIWGLLLLAAFGVVATVIGVRWTFNLGGAVDAQLARRRAVLELRAQRSGNLGAVEGDRVGHGFYRFLGSGLAVAGFIMVVLMVLLMVFL